MNEPSIHRLATQLAAKSGFSTRTCAKWLRREDVSAAVETLLPGVAKRLGIERVEK